MDKTLEALEEQRTTLQRLLDAKKTRADRNCLGQFATPTSLALDILSYARILLPPSVCVRFFDPAFGTGAFYYVLRKVFQKKQIEYALGFEIDPHYGTPAASLWDSDGLRLKLTDFTREEPSPRFNLIICNPPYVRHHHMENLDKNRLQARVLNASGMKLSGLAGLYCYFMGLSHAWMEDDCIAGWLIPSEFMDVNYGEAIKRYLLHRVTLLRIHRFHPNDVQFADALVSSAIVWFRNAPPPRDHSVTFSFGGSLLDPKVSRSISAKELVYEPKWTRFPDSETRTGEVGATLSDFFHIKRGIATGCNDYFILDANQVAALGLPGEVFHPILPSPRYLSEDEIDADEEGNPILDRRLLLLDTRIPEDEIKNRFPALWRYLETGRTRGVRERYLCRHRSPWYSQDKRPASPIVCTYMGRGDGKSGRPFRFIRNRSCATVANVYLAMYPTRILESALARDPTLIDRVWQVLNRITPEDLIVEGRVYGGGLHKLEPKELGNVGALAIAGLVPDFRQMESGRQLCLFGDDHGELAR